MHVAYIHQHFTTPTGYSGTRSYEMSQRLLRARHRVTMIAGAGSASNLRFDPGKRVTEQEVDGIHVLGVSEPYANVMTYARRILAFGRFARTATRLVRSLDADLVFATSTPLTVGLPGMKGAKALGVPFVFEVRDLWPELPIVLGIVKNPLLVWYLKRMERRIYQAAHRIVALSPGVRDGICRTGYPAERVTMIPNSADTTLFRPAADKRLDARFGPPEDFRLVFTGAHGPANGLDAVLDAAVVLRRRNVRGIRFVFIGWGRERERLIQRSRSDGTIDTISWLKAMPKRELAAILPRMDVGMMILKNVPAFYYGTSPNKFFDYMSCGIPALNNYPGWLADLITEHQLGVVVPPDDPEAFADAVISLRDRRAELPAMGQRARRLAESRFARDVLGDQFVATLERTYEEFKG